MKQELITDSDFREYIDQVRDKLPVAIQSATINTIEDLSGNVNRVKRVSFDCTENNTSLIIKHVPERGKLARFPSIIFSQDRLDYENKWFSMAESALAQNQNPTLGSVKTAHRFHYDRSMRVLVMEDLGSVSFNQCISRFNSKDLETSLKTLAHALGSIHSYSLGQPSFKNPAAKQNRPYIFSIHLKEPDMMRSLWKQNASKSNGFDLSKKETLQKQFINKWASPIIQILTRLEDSFADHKGTVYTHGDLHTKSILAKKDMTFYLIDAELCDLGPPAIDPGILLAHIIAELTTLPLTTGEVIPITSVFLETYLNNTESPDQDLLIEEIIAYAGAEILRRLLGPAGFNTDITMEQFESLLELSTQLLLDPKGIVSDFLKSPR